MAIAVIILSLVIILILNALFLFIQKRGSKALGSGAAPNVQKDPGLEEATALFLQKDKQELVIKSNYNGNKLVGWFTDNDADTTVILVHGFGVDHNSLNVHAQLFSNLGYNVLQVDNQAAGKSEGKYIGYGFIESRDLLQWIDEIVRLRNDDIILFGASMGAATVMLTAGEKLSDNVKAIIEDSGYTSTIDVLSYHCQQRYHIKGRLLIRGISLISKIRAGFFYGRADCQKALKKNHLPVLFIHGTNDLTVPFCMKEKLLTCGNFPKMSYTGPGIHIRSYYVDSINYRATVEKFLKKYLGESYEDK